MTARVVGLTGGIGAGKSTVARLLAGLGAVVVDADALAHEVTRPRSRALRLIVEAFGPEVITPAGELDRRALADRVFKDPDARRTLESITHPRIARLSRCRIRQAMHHAAVVIYEAPLLFERDLDQQFEATIVVDVDPDCQRRRVTARDGQQGLDRIASQLPLAQKRARATHVIDNSGPREATEQQVAELWQRLTPQSPRQMLRSRAV